MTSPVTTAFESKPRRVRNIFICSVVVFCASSRMTNASFSVRPRMNASGATSMTPCSIELLGALEVHHVVQRVVERPQVRVDLLRQVPGRKPSFSPASTAGRARTMRLTSLVEQRAHRHRHREVGLAGAGRPDAEDDVVLRGSRRRSASAPGPWARSAARATPQHGVAGRPRLSVRALIAARARRPRARCPRAPAAAPFLPSA